MPHLHPCGVVQVKHIAALLLAPIAKPVVGEVLPSPAAMHVHGVLSPAPESEDSEIWGLQPAFIVQPFNLMVEILHCREIIPETRRRFTLEREPAQLRGIVT